jgi:hypothetical protein
MDPTMGSIVAQNLTRWKRCSFEYIDYPQPFFTPHHLGRWLSNAISGVIVASYFIIAPTLPKIILEPYVSLALIWSKTILPGHCISSMQCC